MNHFRIFKLLPFAFLVVFLSSCQKALDEAKIEDTIKSSITKQGGTSLKSVICPNNIKPKEATSFECTGVLEGNIGFPISVKQQDNQGNVVWDLASVKGLLNMVQLQTEFEQGLKKEIGRVSIDCGGAILYRPVKPGESFECKLLKRDQPGEKSVKQSDKDTPRETLQVTIQPSGDINWQRIIRVSDPNAATIATNPTPKLSTPETTQPESKPSETPKFETSERSPTPPAAKSPEDFLNQPGAADDFN